mmetsp:Transcript_15826/g.34239  ORF Transcript_15826/g.34239 Transcript_15826/m.34239 type:complete len:420 (+) Transcript_15826:315-1574(+)
MKPGVGAVVVLCVAAVVVRAQGPQFPQLLHVDCAVSNSAAYLMQQINTAPSTSLYGMYVTTPSTCEWEVDSILMLGRSNVQLHGFRFRFKPGTGNNPIIIVNAANVKFTEHVYESDAPSGPVTQTLPFIAALKPSFSATSVSMANGNGEGVRLYSGVTDFNVQSWCADMAGACVKASGASHGSIDASAEHNLTAPGFGEGAVVLEQGAHNVQVKARGVRTQYAVMFEQLSTTGVPLHDVDIDGVECSWCDHAVWGTAGSSEAKHENIKVRNVTVRSSFGAIRVDYIKSLLIKKVLVEDHQLPGNSALRVLGSEDVNVQDIDIGSESQSGGDGAVALTVLHCYNVGISRVALHNAQPSSWSIGVNYYIEPVHNGASDFGYLVVGQVQGFQHIDVFAIASGGATVFPIFLSNIGTIVRNGL